MPPDINLSQKSEEVHSQLPKGDKININTATAEELALLDGIGDAMAARIIEVREKKGGFGSIGEIKEVSGIGDKLFEKIKDYIVAE